MSEIPVDLLDPPAVDDPPPPDDEPYLGGVEVDAATVLGWAEEEPVGPGLHGLLAEIDPAGLDTEGQLRLAQLWAALEAHVAAGKLTAVAAAAGPTPPLGPQRGGDFVADEIGQALGLGAVSAHRVTHAARQLVDRLPGTLAALRDGRISYLQALCITETSYDLPADACGRYEDIVLGKAPGRSPGQTRALAARTAARVDAAGFTARANAARSEVDAGVMHTGDGTATLWARLTGVDAAMVDAGMDAWARSRKAAGDTRPLRELRAGALVDWAEAYLTGPDAPRQHGRPVTVNVTVDLPTFLGLTDQPGELCATGAMIPAQQIRELLTDATIRRLIIDPVTGHLLDHGQRSYRIPAATAAFIHARDITSSGPGSTVPAIRCDIDHAQPWPTGPTDRGNLQTVNRRWHRAKTIGGWIVTALGNGRFTWTSPHGIQSTVEPHDYRLGP